MLQDQKGLLGMQTPLMFADGTAVYKKFAQDFIRHKRGLFILAPSGVGKSHFVRRQKVNHWIDADRLWRATRAIPKGPFWEHLELIEAIDQQCDIITAQAKKMGFWLMGASCDWLRPDAIVIPHWQTHKKFIRIRELNYDGGATSDRLQQVLNHRHQILGWAKKGVPRFYSIEQAVDYLSAKVKKSKQ